MLDVFFTNLQAHQQMCEKGKKQKCFKHIRYRKTKVVVTGLYKQQLHGFSQEVHFEAPLSFLEGDDDVVIRSHLNYGQNKTFQRKSKVQMKSKRSKDNNSNNKAAWIKTPCG